MRRLLPWGLAAAVLAACQISPPAAPPSPPDTQHPVPVVPDDSDSRLVSAPLLFLTGPDTVEAGQTATLMGRAMLPAGSQIVDVEVQSLDPTPSPSPSSRLGGGFGSTPTSSHRYSLLARAKVPHPEATKLPVDFEIPFTPPAAGTYYMELNPRRYAIMVTAARRTSSTPGASPAPSPIPEPWGVPKAVSFPADEAILGNPKLIERQITGIQLPTSARIGQRIQMVARFWTNGLGKNAVDAYVDGQQIRVTGLSMPDTRAVMGPIPQLVEVPFSVLLTERGMYSVISGMGEGSFGTISAY